MEMNENIWAVIPARFASTRLPGKPLREVAGKPLIEWVWRAAVDSGVFERVIIATDDKRIEQAATAFGAEVKITGSHHTSGTDRVAEVLISTYPLERPKWTVNIQGDEPMMTADILREFVSKFTASNRPMGTVLAPAKPEEIDDSSIVKAVLKLDGTAIYFSRAKIPFDRDGAGDVRYMKHIGIYGYKTHTLIDFALLRPTALENIEKLEQLRAIERGWDIFCVEIPEAARLIGVDTEEDLARASEALSRGRIE